MINKVNEDETDIEIAAKPVLEFPLIFTQKSHRENREKLEDGENRRKNCCLQLIESVMIR